MSPQVAYPLLAQPGTLGALHFRNRTVMSSLTRNRSTPFGLINADNVEYYRQRARGQIGLILTEGTLISPQGTEWGNAPGIWNQEQVEAWRPLIQAVHDQGCQIVCQLWHLGRQNRPDMPMQVESGEPVWAPSAVSARGGKFRTLPGAPGYTTPTAIPDPAIVLDQYRVAAANAKAAGFDGVELHAANGYLCEQFLSDISNQRTDEWGGSTENRIRFTLAALDAILEVWPADRVGIKLTPTGGYGDSYFSTAEVLVATYRRLITELERRDLAYLQIVNYDTNFDPHHGGKPQGFEHDVLATYSDLVKSQKIIGNSGYDADTAEAELGKRDTKVFAIAFGKAVIANPDLYTRMQEKVAPNTPVPKTFYVPGNGPNGHGYTGLGG